MVSQHIDIFCGHWPGANGDVKYLTFHVTPQDLCDWRIMWLYEWKHYIRCHQTDEFGGHKHYSEDKMFSICEMILQDHVIKWSCEFLGRTYLR